MVISLMVSRHNKRWLFQSTYAPLSLMECRFCARRGDDLHNSPGNQGDLVFYDPRTNASMFLDPANRNMRRELSFNSFKINVQDGDLLIFPSYLTHFVEPYLGEAQRITVAANFWVSGS